MPFAAPWGSLVAGVDRTRLVGPRYVIPIHDWFLSEQGAAGLYSIANYGFEGTGIELGGDDLRIGLLESRDGGLDGRARRDRPLRQAELSQSEQRLQPQRRGRPVVVPYSLPRSRIR